MLGDIINGVDPHGCTEMLHHWSETQQVKLVCLKGNAEFYLLTPDLAGLPGKDKPWNADLVRLISWYKAQLSEADLAWISTFADYYRWEQACLVHDSPLDRLPPQTWHAPGLEQKYQEWFYHSPGILPDMPEPRWQELLTCMAAWDIQQVYCGHTHIPFCRYFGQKLVCNTGSAGASLDGDPRAAWVLVEDYPGKGQTITIQRVDYDIARIHTLIDQTADYPDFSWPGYQDAYKKWMSSGIHWRAHLSQ
jgi:hypothetical protein